MIPSRFQRDAEDLLAGLLSILEVRHGEDLVSFVVFGSVGRGRAERGSDVDLLLVFRRLPADRFDRFLVFHRAVKELGERRPMLADGRPFDWGPVILTVDEARYHSPLYLDMVDDARVLRDLDGFFAGVLDGLRARMRELGSRRVFLGDGSWYWDLKPDCRPGEVFEL